MKFLEFMGKHGSKIIDGVIIIALVYYFFFMAAAPKENAALKEYKDGIQNHLTWSLKGECYFVRPNDDVTVYLIRVADCDKK